MMDPNDPKYSDTHPLEGRRPADPPSPLTAERLVLIEWDFHGRTQRAVVGERTGATAFRYRAADKETVQKVVDLANATLDAARAPDAGLRAALDELDAMTWDDTVPFEASHDGGLISHGVRFATGYIRAALASSPAPDLVLVRRDSGGVFPDGTTNHPAIDFDAESVSPAPAGLDVERHQLADNLLDAVEAVLDPSLTRHADRRARALASLRLAYDDVVEEANRG